jgi:hypothetical protein
MQHNAVCTTARTEMLRIARIDHAGDQRDGIAKTAALSAITCRAPRAGSTDSCWHSHRAGTGDENFEKKTLVFL